MEATAEWNFNSYKCLINLENMIPTGTDLEPTPQATRKSARLAGISSPRLLHASRRLGPTAPTFFECSLTDTLEQSGQRVRESVSPSHREPSPIMTKTFIEQEAKTREPTIKTEDTDPLRENASDK